MDGALQQAIAKRASTKKNPNAVKDLEAKRAAKEMETLKEGVESEKASAE
jgi:hypothetical protein